MSVYRRFIFIGVGLVGLALCATVAVFLILQSSLRAPQTNSADTKPVSTETSAVDEIVPETIDPVPPAATEESPPASTATAGLYVRDLPLSDSQASLLATYGIASDRYITPAEISCLETELGDRYQPILSGDAPSLGEIITALGCLDR